MFKMQHNIIAYKVNIAKHNLSKKIAKFDYSKQEKMSLKIDAYLTPYFPETENLFEDTAVIMIDVLRASTTVCAALHNGAKEIIPSDSLDKAVKIYSSLSKEARFIGGERNGLKPAGFDAGNSPSEFTEQNVANKTVIVTTTNGTKTFLKAKNAKHKIVAGFVNISPVLDYIEKLVREETEKDFKLIILCSGTDGRFSYEDTLCAGAIIEELGVSFPDTVCSDTASAAKNLFNLHSNDLIDFLKTCEHALYLKEIGFEQDIDEALTPDLYPVLPIVQGSSIKKLQNENLNHEQPKD